MPGAFNLARREEGIRVSDDTTPKTIKREFGTGVVDVYSGIREISRQVGMKVARHAIVHAARELFREKGYAGASMQDLADRVGLRKASLYMRFSNKEALVPEVLDLTFDDTLSSTGSTEGKWDDQYEAQVGKIAASLVDRKRCVGLHLAYGVGDDTPIAKEAVRKFFVSLLACLSDSLALAMPMGTAKTVAADALIRLEGATMMSVVFDDNEAMDRVVRSVMEDARAAARASQIP